MTSRNYFLPSLLAGFAAGVLSSVPYLKGFSCCLVIPLAAFFALFLYRKAGNVERISGKETSLLALFTGMFSALFATLFEIVLTLITHTNDFVETLPQTEIAVRNLNLGPVLDNTFIIMKEMAKEIRETGFSFFYSFGILFSNLFTNILFAFAGAFAAMFYLNRRITEE